MDSYLSRERSTLLDYFHPWHRRLLSGSHHGYEIKGRPGLKELFTGVKISI